MSEALMEADPALENRSFEALCDDFWTLSKQAYQAAAEGRDADLAIAIELRGEALDSIVARARDLTPAQTAVAMSIGEKARMLEPDLAAALEDRISGVKGALKKIRRAQRVARNHLAGRDRGQGAIFNVDA